MFYVYNKTVAIKDVILPWKVPLKVVIVALSKITLLLLILNELTLIRNNKAFLCTLEFSKKLLSLFV